MIIPMQYTHFGYKYLQRTTDGKYHSGADLNFGTPGNADLGKPVYAMADGEVIHAKMTGSGWGNMIVIFHPQAGVWSRYAHLDNIVVGNLQSVHQGQLIGHCGDTGGRWSAHLHWDVIIKRLSSWLSYTGGWTLNKVKQHYADPIKFVQEYSENNHNNNPPNMPEEEKPLKPWQENARNWAMRNQITTGENPRQPITRVEMWETMRRYHENLGDGTILR